MSGSSEMRRRKKILMLKICKHISLKCGFQTHTLLLQCIVCCFVLLSRRDLVMRWTLCFHLFFSRSFAALFFFRRARQCAVSHWLLYTRAYVIITFYDYYLTLEPFVRMFAYMKRNFHRTYVLFKLFTEKYT